MVVAKILYQKVGKNFKRTLFLLTMSANFPGDPGETVTLTAAGATNPQATTCDGPNGTAVLGGVANEIVQLGGWQPTLKPVANNPGEYNLSFWNGTTELIAEAYPAAISGGVLVVAIDHDLQGY